MIEFGKLSILKCLILRHAKNHGQKSRLSAVFIFRDIQAFLDLGKVKNKTFNMTKTA